MMDPNDLVPFEDNPRLNDDAVPFVANSIEDFDFNDPIEVTEDLVILSGHTRRKAALQLGLKEVPVVVISGLTEEQQLAYRIAANKTQERAGWDFERLDRQVDDLLDMKVDMSRYGLDLSYLEDREVETDGPEEAEVEEPLPPVEPPAEDEIWVRRGDIIELGAHRLMCGDSTSEDDMARLMNGVTADIAFTSPPYNAGYIGLSNPKRQRKNVREGPKYINGDDSVPEEEYEAFLCKAAEVMLAHAQEVFVDVGVVSGSKRAIAGLLFNYRDALKDLLYWRKTNPVPAVKEGVVSSSVELIIALGRNPSRAFRKDIGIFYGVIDGPTVGNNPYRDVHRATFPEYLPEQMIETFTDGGAVVLDPFMGTGTTLVAAERLGRRCYGMDLEPLYVQLAAERWMAAAEGDVRVIRDGEVHDISEFMARRVRTPPQPEEDDKGCAASGGGRLPDGSGPSPVLGTSDRGYFMVSLRASPVRRDGHRCTKRCIHMMNAQSDKYDISRVRPGRGPEPWRCRL